MLGGDAGDVEAGEGQWRVADVERVTADIVAFANGESGGLAGVASLVVFQAKFETQVFGSLFAERTINFVVQALFGEPTGEIGRTGSSNAEDDGEGKDFFHLF